MAVPIEVLQALATSFTAARLGPEQVQPGVPICFRVTPTSVDAKATDVVAGALNLTWIAKNVRFNNATIEAAFAATPFDPTALNALITGGMPARVPASTQALQKQSDSRKCSSGPAGTAVTS